MNSFFLRHLAESTLFCLLLSGLACLRREASARYAVWLVGVSKFAIPSVLLTGTGAQLALRWPATSWLSTVANFFSTAFFAPLARLEIASPAAMRTVFALWTVGALAAFALWLRKLCNIDYRPALPTMAEYRAFERAKKRIRLRVPVRIRCSEAGAGPALSGFLRPTLIVPEGLSKKLNSAEFEAVLLHELAHARRLDNLAAAFVHSIVCLFWFHPLVWLVEKRLNVERERACDELVIACGTPRRAYVDGILKVCSFHLFDSAAGVSAMTGSDLKRRLEFILNSPHSLPLLSVPKFLIACLALLMPLFPIAGGYCRQCVSTDQVSTYQAPQPAPQPNISTGEMQ